MNVLEAVNGSIDHYTRKLPAWAHALVAAWIVFTGLVYFGVVTLPDIGWWRLLVLAPMVVIVLAVLLQIVVFMVSWFTAPARWLLRRWRAEK